MYENYSVLFVDDEINILSSLRRGLLEEEYSCQFADSVLNALEFMEKNKVHVLITDMRMPVLNGLDLLKQVQEKYPDVIKLVLSGYTQLPQIMATINSVDIFNFILKPWNLDELIVIIRKALDYYILQEENAKYKLLLETKNQTYQNMLKRIDDVVDNARKTAELLRTISNEILSFSKNFSPEEHMKYYSIFEKQYEIYSILSKAVTSELKSVSSVQLKAQITELIVKLFPSVTVDNRSVKECNLNLNIQMLEALITAIIKLFQDEFTQNGLYMTFGYGNKFLISMISKDAANMTDTENGMTVFDAKMVYIHNLLNQITELCQITHQIITKDGNLVIGFSFEEQ